MTRTLKSLVTLMFGALLYAFAINYFLIPAHLGEGGVTGLMTIAYYTLKLPPYLTNLLLNAIIILLGLKFLNREIVLKSLWAVLWLSLFLRIPILYHFQWEQTLIPTTVAGVITGIAMGLLFRAGGSIAGSTILGKILNRYWGIQTGSATLFFDLAVAFPSVFIIGFENLILTTFYLYLSAVLTNYMLSRVGTQRALTIISPHYEQLAPALSQKLGQGITIIHATGYYHHQEQPLLYLMCSSKQFAQAIELVQVLDPQALIITTPIRTARGLDMSQLL